MNNDAVEIARRLDDRGPIICILCTFARRAHPAETGSSDDDDRYRPGDLSEKTVQLTTAYAYHCQYNHRLATSRSPVRPCLPVVSSRSVAFRVHKSTVKSIKQSGFFFSIFFFFTVQNEHDVLRRGTVGLRLCGGHRKLADHQRVERAPVRRAVQLPQRRLVQARSNRVHRNRSR